MRKALAPFFVPLLAAAALLGGCSTMNDPFGGVFGDGARGPAPVRDPYPGQYPGQYPGLYPGQYPGQPGAVQPAMPGTSAGALADSRWRVVTINGRSTPLKGDYRVEFTAAQVTAKFGCNDLGARYTLDRDMLSTDGLVGTKIACGETAMSFESLGSAVLNRPARVQWSPGRVTLTNNAGVIELERR